MIASNDPNRRVKSRREGESVKGEFSTAVTENAKLRVQGSAKRLALGCVNLPPGARGSQDAGFTQPRYRLSVHLCTYISILVLPFGPLQRPKGQTGMC